MDIRLVEAEDKADWSALWEAYLTFYETSRPPEVYEKTWDRIIDPNESMYSALAFQDGKAVGLVNFLYHKSFWDIEERIYLNDLYVDSTHRGLSIGKKLIKAVEKHGSEHNVASVYWLTSTDNAQAQVLYDKVATRTSFIKYQV
ncbi:GNAT family N-acetyltransferase [Amylibacter sp. SFDW26]|uniref:GNAT family N-acetyltransferase n=1 Tax=Amylibacter sp. SFDW26 TaxID=2652722 RepID=UPI001262A8DC|nr:GNAT family N-acetyltransferase [Amylibacter sp. SFDW26]KAB7610302.1 GNAT family N-acetyltransferase [Amylibacter sp. SFDW26]